MMSGRSCIDKIMQHVAARKLPYLFSLPLPLMATGHNCRIASVGALEGDA